MFRGLITGGEDIFQSTQPKRAATARSAVCKCTVLDFNPRSPRGLRQKAMNKIVYQFDISIHAAQEGCDTSVSYFRRRRRYFNPRSPRGLRHLTNWFVVFFADISIHAAQEGCDNNALVTYAFKSQFQSTQPKRAATLGRRFCRNGQAISIHAAQEGCDRQGHCLPSVS